jgi:hypothetical protein
MASFLLVGHPLATSGLGQRIFGEMVHVVAYAMAKRQAEAILSSQQVDMAIIMADLSATQVGAQTNHNGAQLALEMQQALGVNVIVLSPNTFQGLYCVLVTIDLDTIMRHIQFKLANPRVTQYQLIP